MIRPRLGCAWLALSCACTPSNAILTVDIPPDIAYYAVVEIDAQGQITQGSGLSRRDPSAPFGVATSGEGQPFIVGYTAEQIAPLDPERRMAELESSQLERASGCEPRLPTPAWTGRWTADGITEEATPGPRATSAALSGRCPDISTWRVSLDDRCGAARCEVDMTPIDRCHLALGLGACGLGDATLTVDAFGETCVDWGANLRACTSAEAKPAAQARLQCAGPPQCDYDLYASGDDLDAFFEVESKVLFSAPRYVHSAMRVSFIGSKGLPRAVIRGSGYARGLWLTPGEVRILTTATPVPTEQCNAEERSELRRYDAASLELIGATTLASCVALVEDQPAQDLRLSVFTSDRATWRLGEFDRDMRMVRSATTPLVGEAPLSVDQFAPYEIVPLDSGVVAVLFAKRSEAAPAPQSVVVLHDALTLEVIARFDLADRIDPRSMFADRGALVLPSTRSQSLVWLDPASGAIVKEEQVLHGDPASEIESTNRSAFSTFMTGGSDEVRLVGITGTERALLPIEAGGAGRRFSSFDVEVDPFSLVRTSAQSSTYLVGGTTQVGDNFNASIALVRPKEQRYLAGTRLVGQGYVSHLAKDDAGRIFALLPWVPALVRLTPRGPIP